METKTINKTELHSLILLYDLHTQLFFNVIEGISNANAHNRFDTDTSLLGAIGFFIYFEAYAIGQISLWQDYWGNGERNFGEPIIKIETDYQEN